MDAPTTVRFSRPLSPHAVNFIPSLFSSLCVAVSVLSTLPAGAGSVSVTVTFGAQEMGSPLGLFDGTDLPTGNLVRFGYFTLTNSEVEANSGDLPLLNAAFQELAFTNVGYFGGSTVLDDTGAVTSHDDGLFYNVAVGLFAHDLTFAPEALGLLNTQYFMWAFNSPDINTATENAIFSDDGWKTPAFGSTVFDIRTVDPLSDSDVYLAVRGPEDSVLGLGDLNKLQPVTPVPEPQGALLVAAGLAWILTRRRSLIPEL